MNEILIYGGIGTDVVARDIVTQLNEAEGPLTVRIDSYGGDVYSGISIMNALRRYPDVVTAYVDGMAASAASYIAVGGSDRLVMSPNSSMLVHGAWTSGAGNAADFEEIAGNLAQITENIAGIYAEKAGNDKEFWLDVMKKDTTYTAEQAVEVGLADEVGESKKSVAAQQRHLVMAAKRSQFEEATAAAGVPEIVSRSAAPPTLGSRSESVPEINQEKGDAMSILNQLAKELGKKPVDVQNALSGFFNETVTVSGEVEVTYPAETAIAPTERVTVEPTIGDTPAEDGESSDVSETAEPQNAFMDAAGLGLTFAPGTVPEGWDFTVDEATGVVTAKAPTGVEVGDVVEATVKVNDSTEVPVSFKVRSLSDDGEDEGEAPAGDVPAEAPANSVVTVPKAVWDEYMADRAKYAAQLEADKERELEAKIDGHIRDGRYSAAHRGEALAAYKADPVTAERVWGALPKNKAVPVSELGHSGDMENMTTLERMRAKAAANRKNKNKETKNV